MRTYNQIRNPILFNVFLFVLLGFSISVAEATEDDYRIYFVKPISDHKILPFDEVIPSLPQNRISISACRGEYEPASFVLRANKDIESLRIEASSLKGSNGTIIEAREVDIKVVKCWYQAGTAWQAIRQDKVKRVLVPELLLNDDALIYVDHISEHNYLKLSRASGIDFVWISNPDEPLRRDNPRPTDYPVRDASSLCPVNIRQNSNKQIWITIHVPENARPGAYKGNLCLRQSSQRERIIPLELEVLPFELQPPYYTSSIYYRGILDITGEGSISSEEKNEMQLRAELTNMFSHGITNPTIYQRFNRDSLDRILNVREEIGMDNRTIYYLGITAGNPSNLKDRDTLIKKITEIIDYFGSRNIDDVYLYGIDEANGERLKTQRTTWDVVHKLGGKIFVAGRKNINFQLMGDMQDLNICGGPPSKDEATNWHSMDHKIWCYSNPQAGVENPLIYRRNFGLMLWQNDYDGACTYAYQHSFGNIWNDFDDREYRDHAFTYPTSNGVIDTIAWEGYREGVDDVRYVATLRELIEKAKKEKSSTMHENALRAENYLSEINVDEGDLDEIRRDIIQHIMGLYTIRSADDNTRRK